MKTCLICNKELTKKQKKYCSHECSGVGCSKPKVIIPCGYCGKEMSVKPCNANRKRYCSKECQNSDKRHERVELVCKECGRPYLVLVNRAGRSAFCSKECQNKHYKYNLSEIRVCKICGNTFESYVERSREHLYCSKPCALKAKSIASSRRNSKVVVKCEVCEKTFVVFPCRVGEEKYCSRECGKKGQIKNTQGKVRNSAIVTCAGCGKQVKRFGSRIKKSKNSYCSKECYTRTQCVISPSSIETTVGGWLDSWAVAYEPQVAIGNYVIDFLVGGVLCIEVNGCYWHGCPTCFLGKVLNPTQKRKARADKAKRTYLTNRGITLIEIWEHDINAGNLQSLAMALRYHS